MIRTEIAAFDTDYIDSRPGAYAGAAPRRNHPDNTASASFSPLPTQTPGPRYLYLSDTTSTVATSKHARGLLAWSSHFNPDNADSNLRDPLQDFARPRAVMIRITMTSKNFLTEETLKTIEETHRARIEGKTGLYRELK